MLHTIYDAACCLPRLYLRHSASVDLRGFQARMTHQLHRHRSEVQPLEMVDNSINPCELILGCFSLIRLDKQATSSCRLLLLLCFHLHSCAQCRFAGRLLASFMLKFLRMAPAAKDNRALLVLSTVGWFFPLPSLGYTAGIVAPEVCHLVLAAARALPAAMHGDAQNDSKLATIPGGPAVVETSGPWPRCDVPALLPHVGWSDSPVQ